MRPCPRCGSVSTDETAICPACGVALVPAALGQTFVGHRSPEAPPGPESPPAEPQAAFKGTMLGIAPLAPTGGPPASVGPGTARPVDPPTAPPVAGSQDLKRTMLGFGPVAPAPAPGNAPFTQTISMNPGVPKGTLLGMPVELPSPPPAPGAHPGQLTSPAELAPPSGVLGSKRTIMGVAIPGIAPLNPGMARQPVEPPPLAPAWAPLPSPPPPPPPPTESLGGGPSEVPAPGKHRRIPLVAATPVSSAAYAAIACRMAASSDRSCPRRSPRSFSTRSWSCCQ